MMQIFSVYWFGLICTQVFVDLINFFVCSLLVDEKLEKMSPLFRKIKKIMKETCFPFGVWERHFLWGRSLLAEVSKRKTRTELLQ